MAKDIRLKSHWTVEERERYIVEAFWILVAIVSAGLLCLSFASASASQFAVQIKDIINTVYGYVLIIDTALGVLMAAICFIIKMVSKSQHTVEEANAWIKRIAIAWACINMMGLIADFFLNNFSEPYTGQQ